MQKNVINIILKDMKNLKEDRAFVYKKFNIKDSSWSPLSSYFSSNITDDRVFNKLTSKTKLHIDHGDSLFKDISFFFSRKIKGLHKTVTVYSEELTLIKGNGSAQKLNYRIINYFKIVKGFKEKDQILEKLDNVVINFFAKNTSAKVNKKSYTSPRVKFMLNLM
jgi:hypothetical protein